MTFITYGLTGHQLDAPIIFSALQLFNVIRNPLSGLSSAISVIMDGMSGMSTPILRGATFSDHPRENWGDAQGISLFVYMLTPCNQSLKSLRNPSILITTESNLSLFMETFSMTVFLGCLIQQPKRSGLLQLP